MSFTIKNRYLVIGILVLLGLFTLAGYIGGRRIGDNRAKALATRYESKIKAYSYTIDSLQKYAYERDQIIISQKEAIKKGDIEKAELKKLHLKAVNEVTFLKGQVKILNDSVAHNGEYIDIIDVGGDEETPLPSKPALLLPFTFSEKNKNYTLGGSFDIKGKMMVDLSVPLDMDIWAGRDSKTKEYKVVVTSDNSVVKINEIKSFKFDAPKPKRFGIGIHVGYGVTKTGLSPYFGAGLDYNLLTF